MWELMQTYDTSEQCCLATRQCAQSRCKKREDSYANTLFTASTREVFCFEAAMTAPPTGTMKFLSVDCTTASTLPFRQAAVTCVTTSNWHTEDQVRNMHLEGRVMDH